MRRAGDILSGILDPEASRSARVYSALFSSWARIAGQDAAAHTRVRDVRRGIVVVEADHPGWLQLLQLQEKRILKRMKAAYPQLDIHALRYYMATPERGAAAPPEGSKVGVRVPRGNAPAPPRADPESPEYREFRALLERLRARGEQESAG